jgi:hypothetical protein
VDNTSQVLPLFVHRDILRTPELPRERRQQTREKMKQILICAVMFGWFAVQAAAALGYPAEQCSAISLSA